MNKISDIEKDEIMSIWKHKNSLDYNYFGSAEENLGSFWTEGSIFTKLFKKMDISNVLEIACGQGRHAAQIVDKCQTLNLVDTSVDAINFVKNRFSSNNNVKIYLSEHGDSLPFIDASSITSVFSYDAMVHFELFTVANYLNEINRILVPGGHALLHHSNYSKSPTNKFSKNPGWRNYMSKDIIYYISSRAKLDIVEFHEIDWAEEKSDALTLFQKPITP